MFKLIRRLFRWALYLFILVVVLAVAAVLLLNTAAKQFLQSRLRSQTGMDVAIGKVDVGLSTPTVAIEDLRIYNPPEFGGSLFLSVPELFLDYDRDALRARKLHLNLLRLTVAEIGIVKDQKGRLSIDNLEKQGIVGATATNSAAGGFSFGGIDTLNLTLQKVRVGNLDDPHPAEVNFALTNQVFHHLNTEADWQNVAIILAGRTSAAPGAATNTDLQMQKIFRQLLH